VERAKAVAVAKSGKLAPLAGPISWTGTLQANAIGPGSPEGQIAGRGTGTWVNDGLYLLFAGEQTYTLGELTWAWKGHFLIGYDPAVQRYREILADNIGMGLKDCTLQDTVLRAEARPHPSTCSAYRCSVRSGTTTPRRASRSPAFTTVRPWRTSMSSSYPWCAASSAHDQPWPSARCGRTRSATRPNSSTPSWPSPPARSRPHATAASTYLRTVLRSTAASRAVERSPCPRSHSRSTSLTSCTPTSRNVTAASQIR
jgi:hypothetical protein